MLAQDHVRLRKPLEQPVVDHRLGALCRLFGRLENGQHRPVPVPRRSGEQAGGTGQPGDVHVMSAGVHDRHLIAVVVDAGLGAGVVESGGLLDREGVHIGAQHDRRTDAIAQHAHHACPADAGGDLESRLPQPFGRLLGSAVLLEGQLRVGVQITVEGPEIIHDAVQATNHRLDPAGIRHGHLP